MMVGVGEQSLGGFKGSAGGGGGAWWWWWQLATVTTGGPGPRAGQIRSTR